MAVIVAMSLTMASCDGDDYWYDPYGWYDHYDDWGWSNNDWNNGWQGGSQNKGLVEEAQMLTGEWYGPVTYSYLSDDGQSRQTDKFYADMKFFQYANTRDALSGEGVETDYKYNDDGSVADQQTLEFNGILMIITIFISNTRIRGQRLSWIMVLHRLVSTWVMRKVMTRILSGAI